MDGTFICKWLYFNKIIQENRFCHQILFILVNKASFVRPPFWRANLGHFFSFLKNIGIDHNSDKSDDESCGTFIFFNFDGLGNNEIKNLIYILLNINPKQKNQKNIMLMYQNWPKTVLLSSRILVLYIIHFTHISKNGVQLPYRIYKT